jgi:hypothetical protein
VRGSDSECVYIFSNGLKEIISGFSRALLEISPTRYLHLIYRKRKVESRAKSPHKILVSITFITPKSMVEMCDGDFDGELGSLHQPVEAT